MSDIIQIYDYLSKKQLLNDLKDIKNLEHLFNKNKLINNYFYEKYLIEYINKIYNLKKYNDYISGNIQWSTSEQCLLQLYQMDGSNKTISISKNAKLYDLIENISEIFECGNNDISLFLNECNEPLNNDSTIWKTVNKVILKNNNNNTLITSMFVLQSNEPRREYCKIGKTSNCTFIKSTKKTSYKIF